MDQSAVRQSINRGNTLAGTSQFRKAQTELNIARGYAESLGLLDEQLQALLTLSVCSYHLGEIDSSLSLLDRAKIIAETIGDIKAQAKCHLNMGSLLASRDQGLALEEFESALGLFQAAEDVIGTAQALDNVGTLLGQVGRSKDAIPYLTRAEKLFLAAGAVRELGMCYQAMGIIWSDAIYEWENSEDAYQRAWRLYGKASECFRQAKDSSAFCNVTRLIGLLEVDHADYDAAIVNLSIAVKLSAEIGLPPLQSSALLGLGAAFLKMGNPEASLEPFTTAAVIKKSLGDRLGLAHALANQGVALNRLERFKQATACFLEARSLFKEVSDSHQSATGQGSFHSQLYPFWSHFLYSLARQLPSNATRADLEEVLVELEISNATSQIAEYRVRDAWSILDDEELKRDLVMLTRRQDAAKHRRALKAATLAGVVPEENYLNWLADTLDKNEDGTSHRRRLLETSHGAEAWRSHIPADVLNGETAWLCLVDFQQTDEICFVLHTAKENYVSIPSTSSMRTRAIDGLLRCLDEQHAGEVEKHDQSLEEVATLLGKLLDDAGVTERLPESGTPLLLLAHGAWHKFPWECALTGIGYLGLRYGVVRCLSFTQAFADSSRPVDDHDSECAIVCAPNLSTLKHSQAEANMLEELFAQRGFKTSMCTGPDATKEKLLSKIDVQPVAFFHFAGHCTFNQYDASLSALELSSTDQAQGGAITALELSRRCSLTDKPHVFINGCSSGVMEVMGGNRFSGILGALQNCGAGSVVVTAWDVLDMSAVDFSRLYYEALLGGSTVSQALLSARTAVHDWAAAGKYGGSSKIIHWGPYVAYGSDGRYAQKPHEA